MIHSFLSVNPGSSKQPGPAGPAVGDPGSPGPRHGRPEAGPLLGQLSRAGGWGGGEHTPFPPSPEPAWKKSWGSRSELTAPSLVMSLAPRPGSRRQTRCLFCCFIGLLGPQNRSSESWERQHLVGTRNEAYFYRIPLTPPPPATTSLRLTHDRCRERGACVSIQSPSQPWGRKS